MTNDLTKGTERDIFKVEMGGDTSSTTPLHSTTNIPKFNEKTLLARPIQNLFASFKSAGTHFISFIFSAFEI